MNECIVYVYVCVCIFLVMYICMACISHTYIQHVASLKTGDSLSPYVRVYICTALLLYQHCSCIIYRAYLMCLLSSRLFWSAIWTCKISTQYIYIPLFVEDGSIRISFSHFSLPCSTALRSRSVAPCRRHSHINFISSISIHPVTRPPTIHPFKYPFFSWLRMCVHHHDWSMHLPLQFSFCRVHAVASCVCACVFTQILSPSFLPKLVMNHFSHLCDIDQLVSSCCLRV